MIIEVPEKFQFLFEPYKYKIMYSGRGCSKSWSIARALIVFSLQNKHRILCTREFQTSIKDSVHKIICDQISLLKLDSYFKITNDGITTINGSEFIFKGIRRDPLAIKSMEGITICWAEESETMSKQSWDILIPTIFRRDGSELWISFNPCDEDAPTYKRFITNPPDSAKVVFLTYEDNPWFPDGLREEMEHCRKTDIDAYNHIWLGHCRLISDALILNDKYIIDIVKPQTDWNGPFIGVDFGFAQDPSTMIKCWVYDNILYIEKEVYVKNKPSRDLGPHFLNLIPESHKYKIRADCARPETIEELKTRGGLPGIQSCKKWTGSIEDGISFLRSFDKIIIDPNCKHTIEEFRTYSYKVDKLSGDILPDIKQGNDHCILEGSLITTGRGDIPIEQVNITDKVLTRKGWKQVKWAGLTDVNRDIITITTTNGIVNCTPDHNIWTENKGWIRADALRYGDEVINLINSNIIGETQCQNLNLLYTTTKTIEDIQIVRDFQIGTIIKHLEKDEECYIDISGKIQMDKFQEIMKFITKMKTHLITQLTIWNVYLIKNIKKNIKIDLKNGVLNKNFIWTILDHYLLNGIVLKKVQYIINKMENWFGKFLNQLLKFVSFVEKILKQEHKDIEINSVQEFVVQQQDENQKLMILPVFVNNVEMNSQSINIVNHNVVVGRVLTVSDIQVDTNNRVYDITVEDEHEFFVNGVLVHNCIDALRYSLEPMITHRRPNTMKII